MLSIVKLIFYAFSAMAILASSMVVISKNPVKAVLWLVLTFFSAAALWILLEAPFLAVTLVLVYVGAVMVLFLFVVMMLEVAEIGISEGFIRYFPLGLLVAALIIGVLIGALRTETRWLEPILISIGALPDSRFKGEGYWQVSNLGVLLYSQYLYVFEIAGVILLTAIVAAISLTFRGRRGSKVSNPNKQIQVQKKDRLSILKMKGVEPSI